MVQHRIVLINEYVSKGFNQMNQQVKNTTTAQNKLNKSMTNTTSNTRNMLKGFTNLRWLLVNVALVTGVAYGAFRLLMKGAIDLEKEMSKVMMTTGLTRGDIKDLRDELITLANTLPTSAVELAKIATVAGQLGIKGKENISAFTSTIAMMANVSGESADTLATEMAKISRAFDLPISKAGSLASAMTYLFTNTAATVPEITSSLTRVGAAASTLGISVEIVTALQATLIDAGMRAERAGTRMRRAFTQMATSGTEFSKFMGISLSEFKRAMQEDAEGILLSVISKLNKYDSSVERSAKATELFGKVGGFAILTLAENYDSLLENVNSATDAFENQTDLIIKQGIAISNVSDQWDIMKNRLKAPFLTTEGIGAAFIEEIKLFQTTGSVGIPGLVKANDMLEDRLETIKKIYGETENYEEILKSINEQPFMTQKIDQADRFIKSFKDDTVGTMETVDQLLDQMTEDTAIRKGGPQWNAYKQYVADAKKELEDIGKISLQTTEYLKQLEDSLNDIVSKENIKDNILAIKEGFIEFMESVRGLDFPELFTETGEIDASTFNKFLTPFQDLIDQLSNEFDDMRAQVNLFDQALQSAGTTFDDVFGEVGLSKSIFMDYINYLEEITEKTDELTKKEKEQDKVISELNKKYERYADKLEDVRDRINEVNSSISNILSRRFNIRGISETDVGHLIRMQELELARAQFAALGLGSAEEFLNNALHTSTLSMEEQIDVIEDLMATTTDGLSEYEAWKTTLQETIRALIINSNDLQTDVNDVIANAQEELLGINYFGTEQEQQFNSMENYLDALGLAQDIFFGEEQENLQYSEQLMEDRINGMNESAAQAIQNLASEREELENLLKQEEDWIEKQEDIRDEIDDNKDKIEDYRRELEKLKDAYDDLEDISVGSVSGGGGTQTSGSSSASRREQETYLDFIRRMADESDIPAVRQWARDLLGQFGYDDFISRPGVPIAKFDSQDTIIGVKDPEKLMNNGTNIGDVQIIIQGYNRDPKELAIEIQRNIKSLA